ncbi:estrogen receptor beta-like isoform X3 [Brienomyrus brachyistius]|uniref:estrogen receptor beta-like isoform X3 n=1 Tax=Brienomyrus brachyistius TaxID=42636 RepID=UPI0020B2FD93|nr:estrogen receptor beta-like isoform X3 [Brienomyrus brachyistius]
MKWKRSGGCNHEGCSNSGSPARRALTCLADDALDVTPQIRMAASPERNLPVLPTHDPPRVSSPVRIAPPTGSPWIPSPYLDAGWDSAVAGPAHVGIPAAHQPLYWLPSQHLPSLMLSEQWSYSSATEPRSRTHTSPENSKEVQNGRGNGGGLLRAAGSDVHLCAVCHDFASGYHYGVWSCEGCKAFFKRSIQGPTDYICPATNQCTIDKNRRKSCQACRLRKCYEAGMVKCGVRRERTACRAVHCKHVSRLCCLGSSGIGNPRRFKPHPLPVEGPRTPGLSPEQLICRIMEAEPPDIYLMGELKKPFTEASMMRSLTHLADKELVHMISWAKKIPGFTELSLSDQVHLLECCWLEVLMLGLMWRSVDHPGKLIFSPDFILSRDEGSCTEGIVEIFDMLLAATARFRELKLQREEYVCLKALVLLNSNMCLASPGSGDERHSRSKLQKLLDAVTEALIWTIGKMGLSFQQQSARLAHLIMLLSHVRHLSNKGMDHLYCMKMKKMVPLYDLLLEMLDAHIMHSTRIPYPNPAPPQPEGGQDS